MMATELPQSMKAFVCEKWGEPKDALVLKKDIPVPKPEKGELLVKVHSASINPVDIKFMAGKETTLVMKSLPTVMGSDMAGTVVAVGEGASKFKIGDAVIADVLLNKKGGSWAEYCCVPENICAIKPKSADFSKSAAIPLAGLTAYQGLFDHGELQAGQRVVILGASGGVGHFAVQLAKNKGAHVIAVGSTENVEFIKSLGADEVIDRKTSVWWDSIFAESVDLILDCVGGSESWENGKKVLKAEGSFVTTAGDTYGDLSVPGALKNMMATSARKFKSLFTGPSYDIYIVDDKKRNQLEGLSAMCDQNKLQCHVYRQYNFNECINMAQDAKEASHPGKLALQVVSPSS